MENEVLDVKKIKRKIKMQRFTRKAKEKVHNTVKWMEDNKEVLIIVVPAAVSIVGGGFKVIKTLSKHIAIKQEARLRDMRIYDRSLGKYIELKRPLNNSDMKIILERKESGEKLSSILMDLNLIK